MVATIDTLGFAFDAENTAYGNYVSENAMLLATTSLTKIGDVVEVASTHDESELHNSPAQDFSLYKTTFMEAKDVLSKVETELGEYIDKLLDNVPDTSGHQTLLKRKEEAAAKAQEERVTYESEERELYDRAVILGDDIKKAKASAYGDKLIALDDEMSSIEEQIQASISERAELESLGQEGGIAFTVADMINNAVKAFKTKGDKSRDSLQASIIMEMSKLDDIQNESFKVKVQKIVMDEVLHHFKHKHIVTEKEVQKKTSKLIKAEVKITESRLDSFRKDKIAIENDKYEVISMGDEKYSDASIAAKESELQSITSALEVSDEKLETLKAQEASAKKAFEDFQRKVEQDKVLVDTSEPLEEDYRKLDAQLKKTPRINMVKQPSIYDEGAGLQLNGLEDTIKLARGELSGLLSDITLGKDELSNVISMMIYLDQFIGAKYLLTKAYNNSDRDYNNSFEQQKALEKTSSHLKLFQAKITLLDQFAKKHKIELASAKDLEDLKATVPQLLASTEQSLETLSARLKMEANSGEKFKEDIEAMAKKSASINSDFQGYLSIDTEEELLASHIKLLSALTMAIEEFNSSQEDEGNAADDMADAFMTTDMFSDPKANKDDFHDSAFEETDGEADGLSSAGSSTSSLVELNYMSLDDELSGIDDAAPAEVKKVKSRTPSPVLQALHALAAEQAAGADTEDDEPKEEEKVRKFKKKIKPRHRRSDSESFSHAEWKALLPELKAREDLPKGDYAKGEDADDEDDDPIVIDPPRTSKVRFAEGDALEQIRIIDEEPIELPEGKIAEAKLATEANVGTNDAIANMDMVSAAIPEGKIAEAKLAAEANVGTNDAIANMDMVSAAIPEGKIAEAKLATEANVGTNDVLANMDMLSAAIPAGKIAEAKLAAEANVRTDDAVANMDMVSVKLPEVRAREFGTDPIVIATNEMEIQTIATLMHNADTQTDFDERVEVANDVKSEVDIAQLVNAQPASISPLAMVEGNGFDSQAPMEIDEELDVNNRHIAANNNIGMIQVDLSGVRDMEMHHNMPVPEASHADPEIEHLKAHMNRVEDVSTDKASLQNDNFAGKVFSNMVDEGSRLHQNVPLGKANAADINDIIDKDEVFNKVLDYLRRQRRSGGMLPGIVLPPAA